MTTPSPTPQPAYWEITAALKADIAARLGIPVASLRPWIDYDPIVLDETALRLWRNETGPHWTGD